MKPRIFAGAFWLSLLLLCSPALAVPQEEPDFPALWQVQADGWSGTLELSVGPNGQISGMLQDRAVTGVLSGRRLVLHRTTGAGAEVGDGWLAADVGPATLFIAGSVTVSGPDGGRIRPGYAVPVSDAAPTATLAPAAHAGEPEMPAQEEIAPTPAPAAPVVTAAAAPAQAPPPPAEPAADKRKAPPSRSSEHQSGDLSGIWLDFDDRIEIIQTGQSLTVVMPDGTRHEGRFTATDTFVVGLRRGCCKGQMERPDRIRWSDGTAWDRAE